MPPAPVTFLVPGAGTGGAPPTRGAVDNPLTSVLAGRLKHSVSVSSQRAASGAALRVTAVPGEDVVVVHVEGGPTLVLHPENARDLFLSQSGSEGLARGAAGLDGGVAVPVRLQWRGLEDGAGGAPTRGLAGTVALKAIDVVTGVAVDKAADLAASAVVRNFDGQVRPGVYALQPESLPSLRDQPRLKTLPSAADGATSLVLIHGTFSTSSGSFGKLWSHHPDRVQALFSKYQDRVFALDHPTLGASPIANAITLASALPRRARLDLLTHSRGGLVGEVLARVCADPNDARGAFPAKGDAAQRQELRELARIVAGKEIGVDRLVRVACPARGTLLASGRLDAYLSVVKWSLDLAGIPAVPGFVGLLAEIARRRADPRQLPGLAAMIPDSPLVQWLHSSGGPIPGDLRVVAGDMDGDSVAAWVKTLLADAFFWIDNDLVVQTRSMYGGSPRRDATFVLDQGGQVSHFNYFANEHTAGAIVNALVQERPAAFSAIGPLSWGGTSATGTRAARAASTGMRRAVRPAVILVPGVFGSHLKAGARRVWLDANATGGLSELAYRRAATRGRTAARGLRVVPDGVLDVYSGLTAALAADHDVVEFAYDWRRPIEDGAALLAGVVKDALDRRAGTGAAVRLVAHSSGALLVRAMQWRSAATWRRMANAAGARVLMLGPPNGGSWLPMQLLTGDETLGNVLSSLALPFATAAVRQMCAGFPGLLQLQADLTAGTRTLARSATWKALAAADISTLQSSPWHGSPLQSDAHQWGIPPQPVLDAAVAFRKRLAAQRRSDLGGPPDLLVMVTGTAPLTPDGFEASATQPRALVYFDTQEGGDGRVSLRRARFEGIPAWSADADHAGLVSRDLFFDAYLDLLEHGTTGLLPQQSAAAAGDAAAPPPAMVTSRPSRAGLSSAPPQQQADALLVRPPDRRPVAAAGPALRITVVNGDLTFVVEPLMLGHYRASKLTGTERVMDGLIGGAMQGALQRGLYPVAPGSHQIFINTRVRPDNPWQPPRPRAVIVVGLGEEGSLRAADLTATVRQAVIAWAQRVAEDQDAPDFFTLATTLIGSGGTGISAAESAQLIARGVREANERLDEDGDRAVAVDGAATRKALRPWPRVDALRIIELYGDRAGDAWRTLQMLATASPAAFVLTEPVVKGTGALRQPLESGYRGADYDLISALSHGDASDPAIVFTIDTRRARSEVRAQHTQGPLIRSLVAAASNNLNRDPQFGRTLFQLLVPREIEAFLGGRTDTQIEVDRGTAGIPWELLDVHEPGSSDPRPWAIRTKLLRRLRTATFRDNVADASADDGVLVIGDPAADRTRYPRLFGARREAIAVARALEGSADNRRYVRSIISALDTSSPEPDAKGVINAVLERDWRIVHVAGHGEAPERLGEKDGNPRGVVLSDGAFLGPREIECMRTVPELVFVNCCHLAGRNINQLLSADAPTRAEFAAGVAEALISIGVRCVIAAGWAVDDDPANAFATAFYTALLGGCRFIDAVAQAREDARRFGGNTWAAYQCYGDPDWRYRPETGDAQRPAPPADEFASVSSANTLVLALETLAVRSEFQHAGHDAQARRIRYLEAAFGNLWSHVGAVAEAFGHAWAKNGDQREAIEWYQKARAAADGSVSMAALEQLANFYVRSAWRRVESAEREGKPASAPRGRVRGKMAAPLADAVKAALDELGKARELLDRLIAVGPSLERFNLFGSLHKREAMIHAAAGNPDAELAALASMRARYLAARTVPGAAPSELFYPLMNLMAAELAAPADRRAPLDEADLAAIRSSLAAKMATAPDFWSVVGQTELKMYEAVAAGSLAAVAEPLRREFREHHQRVSAPGRWESVYDNATLILRRYSLEHSGAERKAADSLLETLRQLSSSPPPIIRRGTAAASGTGRRRRAGTGSASARPAGP